MVMSITVFVALQSFSGLLDTSAAVQQMHLGDYAVTNETVGIPPEAASELKEHEMVGNLSTVKLSVYQQDEEGNLPVRLNFPLQSWESFQIAGIDSSRLASYTPGLSDQDLLELQRDVYKRQHLKWKMEISSKRNYIPISLPIRSITLSALSNPVSTTA